MNKSRYIRSPQPSKEMREELQKEMNRTAGIIQLKTNISRDYFLLQGQVGKEHADNFLKAFITLTF